MTLLTDDHLTRLSFSIYENRGVYALLIGSGLSRAAQIPTGWEITLDLIRRIAMAQGEEEQADWEAWYRKGTGKEPDYSELVGELGLSADERRSILHGYIEPTSEDRDEGRKLPTPAHYAIADLVKSGFVRVIITTNFDRLLESALREEGIEPTIVAGVDMLNGAEPVAHSNCYLLKLHGDYKDSRILNTAAELSSYPPEYDDLLDRIIDEHGLIVCGWSGEWDHSLRAAISRSPARRYSMYWAARGRQGSGARDLIAHRKGVLVTIEDADTFFVNIRDRVETLARTHRQNPQSITLLVNSAKQYLGRSEHRINLDDLLTSQANSLVEKLSAAELPVYGELNTDEFQRRVAVYEAITEPLARLVGVLGRWGDYDDVATVMDIVRFVRDRANKEGSGLTCWIDLQSYPAVLLVASYGIGLVRSQRWRALHLFLSSTLENRYSRDPVRVVEELFLSSWGGGDNRNWRLLPGMDRHKTALSDHLCELLESWGSEYVGIVPSFEILYETWEIISSVIYCERYSLEELQRSMLNEGQPGFAFTPVGRSGWNTQIRNRIIRNIQGEELKRTLLNAGIGKGQGDFFDVSIESIERIAGRMSWW